MTDETISNGFALVIPGVILMLVYWFIGFDVLPPAMFVLAGVTLWIEELFRRTRIKKLVEEVDFDE